MLQYLSLADASHRSGHRGPRGRPPRPRRGSFVLPLPHGLQGTIHGHERGGQVLAEQGVYRSLRAAVRHGTVGRGRRESLSVMVRVEREPGRGKGPGKGVPKRYSRRRLPVVERCEAGEQEPVAVRGEQIFQGPDSL